MKCKKIKIRIIKYKGIILKMNKSKIIDINASNFENIVSNGIVLIDFWAIWCGPCRMFSDILEEIADEVSKYENVKIAKINIEEEKDLSRKFKIRSIPAIIIFKNGNIEKQFVGIQSKENLIKEIKELI